MLRKIARFTSLLRIDNVNVAIYKIYKYLFMFTYSFEYIMYVPINIYMHVILAVVFHYLAFIIQETFFRQLISLYYERI